MSTDLDLAIDKVKKKGNLLKWGLGLGTVALLGPVIWFLVYAMLGAAALGAATVITGAIVLGAINYYPVFTMKLANRKIQMIKDEAAANPIETFQNIYIENERELQASRASLGEQAASVETFRQECNAHEQNFPEDTNTIAQMRAELADYLALLEQNEEKWRAAKEVQVKFDRTIQMMKSRYKAALAGIKANKLSGSQHGDIMKKIKAEAAYDSVMATQAKAFSELRMARLDGPAKAAAPGLAYQPANVIEMDVSPKITSVVSARESSRKEA